MDRLNHIWEKQSFNNRHIVEGLSSDKKKRHITNFNNYYINFVDTDKIEASLDWGCGGGLLTKELKKFSTNVYCVDISEHSLSSCVSYANPTKAILLNTDPLSVEIPNVDLILANAIVWHFPTLDYFKKVINKWLDLSPKYIAFNTKSSSKTTETENYEKDFLNALFLNDDDTIELFESRGCKLLSKTLATNTSVPSTYFVFTTI